LAGGNTFTGDQIFSDSVRRSVALNVTAVTGGQAAATSLTKDINTIASSNSGYGVKLPAAVAGKMIFVHNTGTQSVLVYPQSGEVINNLAANAALTLRLDENSIFFATSTGAWKSLASGSPLTTKGDLYTYSTTGAALAVGADGKILKANSATATGLEWGDAPVANVIRAGRAAIATATSTSVVTFSTALANTNYAVNHTFENTTDTDPIFLQAMITAKSTTGFTATFNAPTDSANYVMNWQAIANA
jgi:hypothetical protein